MKNKIIWTIVIVLVLVITGALVNQNKNSDGESGEVVKIGALLILSGDFAKYGERSRYAIELALRDYQAENLGKEIEVIYEDTRSEPKQALSAYQKLVSVDKVDAIIGPQLQVEMAAIMPQVSKDGVPMFSIAPVTKELRLDTANPLVFWPDPTLEASQMADYVYQQGVKTIAILGTQDSWENEVSEAFASRFTALGGTVVGQEIVLPNSTDVRLAVTKVISNNPEAVFLGTYYKFFNFSKILSELSYKGKLYSIEIDTYLAEEAASYTNGLRFISSDFYTDKFNRDYQELAGEIASIPAGQTYDAARALFSFLSETNDRAELLAKMEELTEYDGVSGEIIFTNNRAKFPLSIFELRNGEIKRLVN